MQMLGCLTFPKSRDSSIALNCYQFPGELNLPYKNMRFSIIISYSYSTRIKQIPIKGYMRKKLNQTIADACGLEAFRYCVMSTILHQQETEMHS